MLQQSIIKQAATAWAPLIAFAPKKNRTLQFRVDYENLNAVALRDLFPIPRMDGCIDCHRDFTTTFTLHASSRYWQVKIDDREK